MPILALSLYRRCMPFMFFEGFNFFKSIRHFPPFFQSQLNSLQEYNLIYFLGYLNSVYSGLLSKTGFRGFELRILISFFFFFMLRKMKEKKIRFFFLEEQKKQQAKAN